MNPSARRPRRTRRAGSSRSRSTRPRLDLRAAERATERELKALWVEDPAVAWAPAPELLRAEGTRLPVPGIKHLHLETRQAVATETPTLETRPVTRATLLIEWKPTGRGRGSPAFRDPKTGKIRPVLRQLRSVVLPVAVPAHEVRDWILGRGKYRGRRRVQETLGPEVSGGKLELKDIQAVIPRTGPRTATGSALREYFAERIVPRLLAGKRQWSAERVATAAMERAFRRELSALISREARTISSRRSPTRASSSRKRSAGSGDSSSRRSSRR